MRKDFDDKIQINVLVLFYHVIVLVITSMYAGGGSAELILYDKHSSLPIEMASWTPYTIMSVSYDSSKIICGGG